MAGQILFIYTITITYILPGWRSILIRISFSPIRVLCLLSENLCNPYVYYVTGFANVAGMFRGVAWEAWLRGKLGQVELADQVEVLHWLSSVTGTSTL